MGRLNIFEGSRRIALLAKIAWALGALLVGWPSSPTVPQTFITSGPDAPFVAGRDCQIGTDAAEFVDRALDGGGSVYVELCFKAQRANDGNLVVPFKVDGGQWWGNTPYTAEVTKYTQSRADAFELSVPDTQLLKAKVAALRREQVGYAVLAAVIGWVVLSVLQAIVGWVVRGFLGVPSTSDSKPARPAASRLDG